jgi:hypothetical protein
MRWILVIAIVASVLPTFYLIRGVDLKNELSDFMEGGKQQQQQVHVLPKANELNHEMPQVQTPQRIKDFSATETTKDPSLSTFSTKNVSTTLTPVKSNNRILEMQEHNPPLLLQVAKASLLLGSESTTTREISNSNNNNNSTTGFAACVLMMDDNTFLPECETKSRRFWKC